MRLGGPPVLLSPLYSPRPVDLCNRHRRTHLRGAACTAQQCAIFFSALTSEQGVKIARVVNMGNTV